MIKLLTGALALTTVFVSSSLAEERTFKKPKSGQFRVDWCYKWGVQCGETAAKRYCKSKGYDDATDFAISKDIGDEFPTKVLSSGQICDDETCDGFKFITCERSDEEDEDNTPVFIDTAFNKPSVDGVRIHFCYVPGKGCGQKAADFYCKGVGYEKALSYQQSTVLIALKTPRYLGTGQLCEGLDCVGFKTIQCRKEK
jgi:hypothetical protein